MTGYQLKSVKARNMLSKSTFVWGLAIAFREPKGGSVQVHALVYAYAPTSANGAIVESKRIQGQIHRGDVSYVDTKKASELLGRSGLQLLNL